MKRIIYYFFTAAVMFLLTAVTLQYWKWFFTPVFGIAVPSFWMGFGVLCTFRIAFFRFTDMEVVQAIGILTELDEEELFKIKVLKLGLLFAVSLILWPVGWVIHQLATGQWQP
jgi:hypothetical protein